MAERIVHILEVVEIEKEQGNWFSGRRAGERRFQPFGQLQPVRQASQCIVMSHMGNARFGLALESDVGMGAKPATTGHRSMMDFKDLAVHQFIDSIR